jgi:hypothetical protein
MPFAQAYPRPSAIPIHEFDAGCLERAANRQIVCCRHRSFALRQFSSTDCSHSDCRFTGQILSPPPKKSPGSPDLTAGQGSFFHVDVPNIL